MILALMAATQPSPWLSQGNPAIWNSTVYSDVTSVSGERVNPDTMMALSAVYACIDVISTDSSVYPINIMRRRPGGRSENANAEKSAEYALLNGSSSANALAITTRRFLVAQCLGWGNGYWEIQRTGRGDLYALHPIQSARMEPFYTDGILWWKYRDLDGSTRRIDGKDLVHLCGPSDNGLVGWPVAYWGAECFGTGLSEQKFAAAFFSNGAMPTGVLEHPGAPKVEAEKRILESWKAAHSGDATKMRKTALLIEGMKYQQISVDPINAQLLDSRKFTLEEVCRWFRVPPEKIMLRGQAKGWATTEAGNRSYLLETLMPWNERVEAEVDRKLLGGEEYYCEHDYSRLLQPDAPARADIATKLFSVGAITQNELREREGLNPIGPDGDVHYVPVNLQPVERALRPPDPPAAGGPAIPPAQTPAAPPAKEPTKDDDEARHRAFVLRTLERAASRALRKEAKAVARMSKSKAGLDVDLDTFEGELVAEMLDEFCAILETPQTSAHQAIWIGYADLACKEYRASKDVGATSAARETNLPAQWAREMVALRGVIGAQHA